MRDARMELRARAGWWCEVELEGVCQGAGGDPHHVRKASAQGANDAANLLQACRRCHDWIETHPIEAKELGLSVGAK